MQNYIIIENLPKRVFYLRCDHWIRIEATCLVSLLLSFIPHLGKYPEFKTNLWKYGIFTTAIVIQEQVASRAMALTLYLPILSLLCLVCLSIRLRTLYQLWLPSPNDPGSSHSHSHSVHSFFKANYNLKVLGPQMVVLAGILVLIIFFEPDYEFYKRDMGVNTLIYYFLVGLSSYYTVRLNTLNPGIRR